uniref:Uncharacterized protein n=1 Tax=Arion vulgaris TaxID=1028688 RepID=A0A0B6ZID9_9EUPU
MELTCKLDQTAHKKMIDARRSAGGGGGGTDGGCGSSVGPPGSAESNEGFESSTSGFDFSKAGFQSEPLKEDSKQTTRIQDSSKTLRKYNSFEAATVADVSNDIQVVLAKDRVSVVCSTFTDSSPEAGQVPQEDVDLLTDSGAASRTSYRVDSDVSIRSASAHSLATGDSGCWPKE